MIVIFEINDELTSPAGAELMEALKINFARFVFFISEAMFRSQKQAISLRLQL